MLQLYTNLYKSRFKNQLAISVHLFLYSYMLLCSADSEDKDKGTYENLCDPCMANSY